MINTIQKYGISWGVFSPENYPVKVYFRKLAEKYEGENFDNMSEQTVKQSISELSGYINLIVDNEEDEVTIEYLFERIRALVFRAGIKGVILDPWNEVTHDIGPREDLYIAKVLRKIKKFIRKYDLSFWLVVHPRNPTRNSDGTYNKVTAYDISGGSMFNNKADNIFSIWRDKSDIRKPVEVDILKIKQKTDGALGTCYFHYQFKDGTYQSCRSSLDELDKVVDYGGASVNDW